MEEVLHDFTSYPQGAVMLRIERRTGPCKTSSIRAVACDFNFAGLVWDWLTNIVWALEQYANIFKVPLPASAKRALGTCKLPRKALPNVSPNNTNVNFGLERGRIRAKSGLNGIM